MQLLSGFRDFYPEDCARRNYILGKWREVARRYGFVEYDGPLVEPLALYEKKSGGELVGQIFTVATAAEPGVVKGALRPEMTPTLARMVAARERDFKKPLKWFCVPNFFRHERQQRGRLREFYQFNCDIIGEASPAADAELLAVLIDSLRALALTENDFVVRIGSRAPFFKMFEELAVEQVEGVMQVVDKMERTTDEKSNAALEQFELTVDEVRKRLREASARAQEEELAPIKADLTARGFAQYIEFDFSIVRGLAYYTGVVFEVFDRSKNERALAGGGRYDGLLSLMSDGKVDLPALGFGMGDVVLANLIDDTPHAKAQLDAWLARNRACDVYVVIAKEERRADALALVQSLRESGLRVDFPLTAAKVGKQFQTAEQLGATRAVLVGDEWPHVKLKTLATREEALVALDELPARLSV